MKPDRITGYMLGEKYLISGGKTYRIEKLTDDESIAETYNGGDALPIIPARVVRNETEVRPKGV